MFKNLLIDWVTELNEKIATAGDSGYLTISLSAFNPTLYAYIKTIMSTVVMPVAYVILALFCLLELYRCSVQADGAASGTTFSLEIVGMEAVYQVSQHITLGISSIVSSGSVSSGLDLPAVIDEINGMGTGEQIGMLIELVIVKFGVLIILGIVNVICIGRFIEIYVMIAIAPIPIATLPSQELSSIGKNFFKSFAAVCVQGILIYLVVSFFPVLISNDILGDSSVFGMLLYSLVLGVSVLSCGRWAKSICNAF